MNLFLFSVVLIDQHMIHCLICTSILLLININDIPEPYWNQKFYRGTESNYASQMWLSIDSYALDISDISQIFCWNRNVYGSKHLFIQSDEKCSVSILSLQKNNSELHLFRSLNWSQSLTKHLMILIQILRWESLLYRYRAVKNKIKENYIKFDFTRVEINSWFTF